MSNRKQFYVWTISNNYRSSQYSEWDYSYKYQEKYSYNDLSATARYIDGSKYKIAMIEVHQPNKRTLILVINQLNAQNFFL